MHKCAQVGAAVLTIMTCKKPLLPALNWDASETKTTSLSHAEMLIVTAVQCHYEPLR